MASHQGNGVHEGRRRLVIPSGLALGHRVSFLQRVGGQGDPGEDSQQDGRGAGDGQVGPLALGFQAQVGPHLLKGNFQLPAQDKPFQDLGRVRRGVGAQQGLGGEGALGISDQHPADADWRLAGAVPDRRLRREFHGAGGAVIPGHGHAGPSCLGLVEDRFQRGSPRAFQRRAAVLTRLTGWRGRIESGVQP